LCLEERERVNREKRERKTVRGLECCAYASATSITKERFDRSMNALRTPATLSDMRGEGRNREGREEKGGLED
jgi:hypothetical protein